MNKLLSILLITTSIYAQSIKENQNMMNTYLSGKQSIIFNSQTNINKDNANLTKAVFGYLPYWEYYLGNHEFIQWSLLTHLAVFSFEVDSVGNLMFPDLGKFSWPWNSIIDSAKNNNVKLIMTIVNFDPEVNGLLLSDEVIRQNLFSNIISKLKQYDFDGVNIDFEYIDAIYTTNVLRDFLRLLKEEMTKHDRDWEISFATPIYGWGNWDFKGMTDYCDYLMIMGYDFYGKWANTTGPSAPLVGQYISITDALEEEYKNVPPDKIILGVPYYGNMWNTKSSSAYAGVIPYNDTIPNNDWQSILKYSEAVDSLEKYEKLWDNSSQTSWLRKQVDDTTWSQIWYDDSLSLALKYDLIIQKNFKGVGLWALGYDGQRKELWNLIKDKFTIPTSVDDITTLPESFVLYQNYPNPFNPETIISYSLPKASHVKLKVYDILGREVIQLINEMKPQGYHKINFSTSNLSTTLSSGVYFYRLTTSDYSQIKKMILLR